MTDNPIAIRNMQAVEDSLTYGPAMRKLRATWIAAGLDVNVFDNHYSEGAASTAPVGKAEPGQTVDPVTPPALSEAEANALAERLAQNGMGEAEIAAEMERQGYVVDDRSEAQIAWDQEHLLDTPRDPSQYKIDVRALGMLGRPITEVVEAQATWGEFLSAAQVNPAVGVGLVEHMSKQGHAYAKMPEFDRQLWALGQQQDLLRHAGSPEAVQQIKNDAGFAIAWAWDHTTDKLGLARVVEAIGESGASKDAFVVRMLASVGKNLREWTTGRPK